MKKDFLWWRDGVIYQIYPRSFADSNGDGIGDLNGIRNKLGYLEELGVDAIWLSPISPSPDVDFGYDVSDYCAIDPKFGDMREFEQLITEAHQKNIHIIMDLVFNHTSDQHPWFIESRKSRDNPYHDYYLWHDAAPNGKEPNNWASVFGGNGWKYDPQLNQYYFHMFYPEQPDLNWRNPKVRKALLDVVRFWLAQGVDGFRLDVFNLFFKDSKFQANPSKPGLRAFDRQNHLYDVDQVEMIPLLQEFRSILDEKPGRYSVGEPFIPASSFEFLFPGATYTPIIYCGEKLLHQQFCFDLINCRWKARKYRNAIQKWDTALREKSWPTYVMGNHDNPRPATRLVKGEDDSRLKVMAVMLLTLRGTPYIYNGDEIGQRDIRLKKAEIKDAVGRTYWPLYQGRDGCRAPMQWDATPNAGFCKGKPWQSVHPDYAQRNVAGQIFDPNSLLNLNKQLIHLRRKYSVLVKGDFKFIDPTPRDVLVYLRTNEDENALVALNFSKGEQTLNLNELAKGKWDLLLSTQRQAMDSMQNGVLTLKGNEALILLRK